MQNFTLTGDQYIDKNINMHITRFSHANSINGLHLNVLMMRIE